MVDESVIESAIKYRDGKKWKQRWAVLTKLSPVADVLQLQLYRDSRDRIKSAPTKASLALQNILAVETGTSSTSSRDLLDVRK
ncbi:protein Dok-7-like [Oratosquilla oratoria]|uniref:protein Dok-7-like n=1 Tax=Oratosquilla oratoria TaxID=337810 RepID=UPI003F765237